MDRYRLALIVTLLASSGCSRKQSDEAPCGAVAARLFTIATDGLAKATVEPATRRMVSDQLPAMRDSLVQLCTDGGWSASVRNCMAGAPDHAAMQICQRQLTDAQRSAIEQAAQGKTPSH